MHEVIRQLNDYVVSAAAAATYFAIAGVTVALKTFRSRLHPKGVAYYAARLYCSRPRCGMHCVRLSVCSLLVSNSRTKRCIELKIPTTDYIYSTFVVVVVVVFVISLPQAQSL